MYTKDRQKKRKKWHDGVLVFVRAGKSTLKDTDSGKDLKAVRMGMDAIIEGDTIEGFGYSYDLDIASEVPESEYLSGRLFLGSGSTAQSSSSTSSTSSAAVAAGGASSGRGGGLGGGGLGGGGGTMGRRRFVAPSRRGAGPGGGGLGGGGKGVKRRLPAPRHDPGRPGAFILDQRPGTVPVVVDPLLGEILREHQKAAVKFLYGCVMGLERDNAGNGAILADDMGLGKTLTTISLLWTLLKQGPAGSPVVRKAVICVPSSLVDQWAAEIKKWLKNERLRPIVVNVGGAGATERVRDFAKGSSASPVLIVSYEMFRKHAAVINGGRCDFLVCDEGHRLKNVVGNATVTALQAIPTRRRLILTGTPIQNNLEEVRRQRAHETHGTHRRGGGEWGVDGRMRKLG